MTPDPHLHQAASTQELRDTAQKTAQTTRTLPRRQPRKQPGRSWGGKSRRLTICDATETQRTIGGFPIGEPRYTWPTEFSGDCYGLDRD